MRIEMVDVCELDGKSEIGVIQISQDRLGVDRGYADLELDWILVMPELGLRPQVSNLEAVIRIAVAETPLKRFLDLLTESYRLAGEIPGEIGQNKIAGFLVEIFTGAGLYSRFVQGSYFLASDPVQRHIANGDF